jgi:hypothetical protein
MYGTTGMMAFAFGFLCACGMASAECDTSTYDQTPPRAIRSDPRTSVLEWATDVDTVQGQLWIWHYVKNPRPDALGVNWPKGGIRRQLGNPLNPGETDCNRFYTNAVNSVVDDDAPITYGTNQQTQPAAVYTPRHVRGGPTKSIIDTSFADAGGKLQQVHVVISSRRTEKGLLLEVDQDANVVIAVSSLPEALAQTSVVDDRRAQHSTFQQFAGDAATRALSGLFSAAELNRRVEQNYVFFPQTKQFIVEIPAATVDEVPADLIILDPKKQPIFATEIRVLIPSKG